MLVVIFMLVFGTLLLSIFVLPAIAMLATAASIITALFPMFSGRFISTIQAALLAMPLPFAFSLALPLAFFFHFTLVAILLPFHNRSRSWSRHSFLRRWGGGWCGWSRCRFRHLGQHTCKGVQHGSSRQ